MSGGLMQLVAYGAQDVYLTGNPQITFFRAVHKRHTNFACEPIEQTINGTADFGNSNVRVTVSRNGDLITNMYLIATISNTLSSATAKWAWVKNVGNSMIDNVSLNIGGQKIDKHYGEWMNIWHELSASDDHSSSWDTMIGNTSTATTLSKATGSAGDRSMEVFVPLNFWFNRNPGLALPLIALQYHEVAVDFDFVTGSHLVHFDEKDWSGGTTITTTPKIDSAKLLVEYVFLDTEERKRFAQQSHEYLIEQVQDQGGGYSGGKAIAASSTSVTVDLHFNHPCKALYWGLTQNKYTENSLLFLGNDLESCTKNFIIRYALSNLATTLPIMHGTVVRFGVSEDNFVTCSLMKNETVALSSSSFTDFNVIGGNNKLNTSGTYYNDLIRVLSAASMVWNVDVWSSVGTGANMTLWNSINVPQVLPAAVCGLDTTVIESCGTAATNMFAGNNVQNLVIGGTGGSGTAVKLRLNHHFGTNLDHSGQTITKALLKLNGNDRFTEREAVYFNKVVPWQSHMNGPPDGIYSYSFAVNPEDHQPSGTCNFSRIDNAQLQLSMISSNLACKVKVYTVNYNVLRIMSGMGGLAYSN